MGQVRKILVSLSEGATDDQLANIATNIKDEYPDLVEQIDVSLWEDVI